MSRKFVGRFAFWLAVSFVGAVFMTATGTNPYMAAGVLIGSTGGFIAGWFVR